MILVVGATGKTGRNVVAKLAARGTAVRCLVRNRSADSSTPELVVGDAADPEVQARALCGIDRVFLAMGNGPSQRAIELGLVKNAERAGVRQIVKVSAPVVGPTVPVAIARMHYEIEQAIAATSMAYTHLRPYAFMQNLLAHAPTIIAWRAIFGLTGDAPINLVDARDVADVATVALTAPELARGALVLTGAEAVTMPEVARRLTAVLGESVTYVHQQAPALRRGYVRAGLPVWLIEHLLEIQQLTLSEPEHSNDVVARVTGQAPRSLDAFLREHADHFRGARTWRDRGLGWLLIRRAARTKMPSAAARRVPTRASSSAS